MLNKVLIIGNLTRDPDLRYTASGKARATFTLAVNRGYRGQSGEREEQTDFISVVAWDKQAEFVHTYLNKGRQVLVEGRLQVRSFTGQDGVKRTVAEVVAERVTFVGPRPSEEGAPVPAVEGGEEYSEDEGEDAVPDAMGDV